MTKHIPFNPIKPHNLALLPPRFNYKASKFIDLLIQARVEIAELKAYSSTMSNQLLLLSPTLLKESIASSGVENINTTMMNVLENQLFPEQEQQMSDKEVLRYKSAVIEGFESLKKHAISTRTIKEIHKRLLTNFPGEFRKNEVKIENKSAKEVVYTPPESGKVNDLLNNLENFANQKDDIDPLVKAAILHYQFEAIHPFNDGNGRTGRILMVLYLAQNNVLHFPTLYISGYILKNKPDYYNHLLDVTKSGAWDNYIEFMLTGFYLQAKETKDFLFKIKSEYFRFKKQLKKEYKAIYNSGDFVDIVFAFPIITPAKLADELGCKWETASKYLKTLTKAGIFGDKKLHKYHFFMNKRLLDILYN